MFQYGKKNSNPSIKIILLFLASGTITALSFNNCGKSEPSTDLAFYPIENLQKQFSAATADSFPKDYCNNQENYSCSERIFSSEVENQIQNINFDCVEVSKGKTLCVSGTSQSYNSATAIELCENCSSRELQSRYEFSEYTCYHKGAQLNGLHPIRYDASNLDIALVETFKLCHKIISGE